MSRYRHRLAVVATAISLPVLAHHGPPTSEVLYMDELIELEGELTEVLWRNPHPRARVDVVNSAGETATWELELGPAPGVLERRGVDRQDLFGRVRAAGYISKRNPESLGVVHFLLPDGRELTQGSRPLRWSEITLAEPADIDPADIARAESDARGLFRVWGRRSGLGSFLRGRVGEQLLTEQGLRLAQAYDPLTDNREIYCEQGMPDAMFDPVPLEIVDNGAQIKIHVQQAGVVRVIHMDVDGTAELPAPSPLGYSVGQWDDDDLVVTTSRVAWPYYSVIGTPQSAEAGYTERFSISADGALLTYTIEITDPLIFADSFVIEATRDWVPGMEIEPSSCTAGWDEVAE